MVEHVEDLLAAYDIILGHYTPSKLYNSLIFVLTYATTGQSWQTKHVLRQELEAAGLQSNPGVLSLRRPHLLGS